MLMVDVRTYDMLEIVKLIQEGNTKILKQNLLRDYDILKDAYAEYNYEKEKYDLYIHLYNVINVDTENYAETIGAKYPIRGDVKFTNDFDKNLIIGKMLRNLSVYRSLYSKNYELLEVVRLKLNEVRDMLMYLGCNIQKDLRQFKKSIPECFYDYHLNEYDRVIYDGMTEEFKSIYDEDCDMLDFCPYMKVIEGDYE